MKPFVILVSFILAPALLQAYPCPERADSLAAYASCMVPLRNGTGTALVTAYSQNVDDHTQTLLNVMQSGPVVSGHVIPSPWSYPYATAYFPVGPATAYMYGSPSSYSMSVFFTPY